MNTRRNGTKDEYAESLRPGKGWEPGCDAQQKYHSADCCRYDVVIGALFRGNIHRSFMTMSLV